MASCVLSLFHQISSISSINTTTQEFSSHIFHTNSSMALNFFSDSQYHFDIKAFIGIYTNGNFKYSPIISAVVVFPVHGGHSNSTAFGMIFFIFSKICSCNSIYFSLFSQG
ncbi:hypothetical protein HOG21_00105 [bacterium]|nr:hypothetical protein [bacterium]